MTGFVVKGISYFFWLSLDTIRTLWTCYKLLIKILFKLITHYNFQIYFILLLY